jgi:hypothetical protein
MLAIEILCILLYLHVEFQNRTVLLCGVVMSGVFGEGLLISRSFWKPRGRLYDVHKKPTKYVEGLCSSPHSIGRTFYSYLPVAFVCAVRPIFGLMSCSLARDKEDLLTRR